MNIEEEKQANADKCIQKAEEAYSSNKLDKAESLLLKAERFYPTELAKRMLDDVRAARNRHNNSENNNPENGESRPETEAKTDEQYKYHRTEADERYAEKCIAIAKVEISKGNYERAQRFVIKSSRLCPSDEIDSLLEQIKELQQNNGPKNDNNNRNKPSGSKEDAERFIDIAQDELLAGNLARAEHLLLKAERVFPSTRAKDLLKQIEVARASGRPETGKPVVTARKPPPKVDPPKPKPQGPTTEHFEAIRRVNEAADDYAMFNVARDSPADVIRKAYKSMAALLHPDKNKAPGSREAFMLMRDAFDRIKPKTKK